MSLKNFQIGPKFIKFEEHLCKTFYTGLCDVKYVLKSIKDICHAIGQRRDPWLLDVYRLYIGQVECKAKEIDSFYLRPSQQKLAFGKSLVGINTLNGILPNMCKVIGIKTKTTHSLRTACRQSCSLEALKKNSFNKGPDIGQMPC